jgi:hypothetical protein
VGLKVIIKCDRCSDIITEEFPGGPNEIGANYKYPTIRLTTSRIACVEQHLCYECYRRLRNMTDTFWQI